MWQRIVALMYKEFLALWRDKKSRTVLIIPSILQLFVFSFAATLDVTNVSMGIYNIDKGEKGFELIERFYHSKTFKHITYLNHPQEVEHFLDNEKGMFVLSIDEQFSEKINSFESPTVQVLLNGRRSNTAQIVYGYVTTIVNQYSMDLLKDRGMYPKITLVERHWFNPNLIYNWFTIPGLLAILTMLIALIVVALSVAREKELGTFDQLLVSPLTALEIMIGKTIPGILIAMLEGTFILVCSLLLFGLPFEGSILLLYMAMLVYVTSIVGFGLFLSTLCSTQQQAILAVFVFMTPAILLSGFASPIDNMPSWLQYVTYLDPVRYFLQITRGLFMKGINFQQVLMQMWPMVLIAIGTLSSASFFFRKKLA